MKVKKGIIHPSSKEAQDYRNRIKNLENKTQ